MFEQIELNPVAVPVNAVAAVQTEISELRKETGPMTPEELAKLARLMMQPTASAAALSSLGLGFASHAIGIWMGMATGALQASQRLFAPGGLPPHQPPAPAEPARSGAPAVLTVLEGGASKRTTPAAERAASAGAPGQEVGPQNGSAAKAPAKAVQNAANSAAALGDPEFGKDFARKAETKTAKPVAAERPKPQAADRPQPHAEQKSRRRAEQKSRPAAVEKSKPQAAVPARDKVREPGTRAKAPAPQPRQPKDAGRPETPDNLKAISGIGPKLEKVLNGLGIWTYAQLAGLAQEEIAWLEDHLGFGGRIGRDDWLGQAKALAPTKQ